MCTACSGCSDICAHMCTDCSSQRPTLRPNSEICNIAENDIGRFARPQLSQIKQMNILQRSSKWGPAQPYRREKTERRKSPTKGAPNACILGANIPNYVLGRSIAGITISLSKIVKLLTMMLMIMHICTSVHSSHVSTLPIIKFSCVSRSKWSADDACMHSSCTYTHASISYKEC